VEFRIADTFTASVARLNSVEQKAVKTTAFDLQLTCRAAVSAFIGLIDLATRISGRFVSTTTFA
jgi:hypothetical protein